MTTTTLDRPRAAVPRSTGARAAALLTVLLGAQLMAILDVNIVNVAAATIRTDLHASGASLQLIIAGYLISYAVLLITGARVGGLTRLPDRVPGRPGRVHGGLAGVRARALGRVAHRVPVRPGRRGGVHDPAGVLADSAAFRRTGPSSCAGSLRGRHRRWRGGRSDPRRGPGRRRPVGHRLAPDLLHQRPARPGVPGGRRTPAAARRRRTRPPAGRAGPGGAGRRGARLRAPAALRSPAGLAAVDLAQSGRLGRCCSPCSRRFSRGWRIR